MIKVQITETLQRIIEIDVDDDLDALEIVENQHSNADIILDSGDFVGVDFEVA